MSLFGSILKTVVDVAALPVEVAKDVLAIDDESKTEKQAQRIEDDVKKMKKAVDDILGI